MENTMTSVQTFATASSNMELTHENLSTRKPRIQCRYCFELYEEDKNRKGSCAFARDSVKDSIELITGMKCARGILYHCTSDGEGDFIENPCSCTGNDGFWKKWTYTALLSLLIPCLCCYPPLSACRSLCIYCGVCGGKHKPMTE